MKNEKFCILSFLVFFSFFFFSFSNLKAATNFDINYDINEHFNYFYEQKNNTPFYQLLMSRGDSLFSDYFKSFYNGYQYVYISYCVDYLDNYSGAIPDVMLGCKYAVVLSHESHNFIYKDGVFNLSNSYTCYGGRPITFCEDVILFFDENANLIYNGSYSSSSTFNLKYNLKVDNTDEFVYIISNYFYGKNGLKFGSDGISTDLRLTRLILNGSYYSVNRISTRSNFLNFWSNLYGYIFNDQTGKDISDLGLSYFIKNYYIKDNDTAYVLYNLLNYNSSTSSISVPDGYSNQTFSYDNRYYLVPNSLTCSLSESLLYFSTTDISSLNLIYYSVIGDSISYDKFNSFTFNLKSANRLEALSLTKFVDKITDNFYIIFSNDNFAVNTFYYNPNCYSVYDSVSTSNIEFVNPNTNNNIIITPGDQNYIYNEISNKSFDLVNDSGTNSSDIDVVSIISGAWSGAKTFINTSYYILGMTTNLFTLLPVQVSSIILCVFSVGMVIVLWKIFRSQEVII